jgi:uncharacterized protein DUF955
MWARGRCDVSAPRPQVFVKKRDNLFAQNFTVAHEVAHLLMHSLSSHALSSIASGDEERLCDRFARDVVVPPARLEQLLAGDPAPSVERVLRLCGVFGANPSVVLSALGGRGGLGDTAYVLARWRGHYRRPAVVDFRIDAAIGPAHLFWPHDLRLRKLGLLRLAESGSEVVHGTHIEGRDSWVMVPRRRLEDGSRHNAMAGAASWQAIRQGRDEPYLLARIKCRGLAGIRLPAPGGTLPQVPISMGLQLAAASPSPSPDSAATGTPRELSLPGLEARW